MRILLVTNFFPPINSIAAHRAYSFAKYLPKYGIDIEVIAPKTAGKLSFDLSNIIVYHPLETTSTLSFAAKTTRLKQLLKLSGIRSFRYYLTSSFFHSAIEYLPNLDASRYDAVLASYPAEDSLRIGYHFSLKWNLPLIVDYRDLWLQNGYLDWTPMDKLVIRRLEERINAHASLILCASQGASEKLKSRFGQKVFTIFNGYWEESLAGNKSNSSLSKTDRVVFCYSGSLYGGKRPVEGIFPVLAKDQKYRLIIAVLEQCDAELVRQYARAYKVEQQVELYVGLSSVEADQLENASDVLLLLNLPDKRGNDVIPAKFYQYMAKNKFILGIGHNDDEIGAILHELNLGLYLSQKFDLNLFEKKFNNWNIKQRKDISFFSRKNQAERLAVEINRIVK